MSLSRIWTLGREVEERKVVMQGTMSVHETESRAPSLSSPEGRRVGLQGTQLWITEPAPLPRLPPGEKEGKGGGRNWSFWVKCAFQASFLIAS